MLIVKVLRKKASGINFQKSKIKYFCLSLFSHLQIRRIDRNRSKYGLNVPKILTFFHYIVGLRGAGIPVKMYRT